jgi:hypothetical protein
MTCIKPYTAQDYRDELFRHARTYLVDIKITADVFRLKAASNNGTPREKIRTMFKLSSPRTGTDTGSIAKRTTWNQGSK